MLLQDGQHILLIGDSITDCGRRGDQAPFGNGYASLLRAFTTARHPGTRLTWTNHGIGGDTVRHLAARWKQDALTPRPDWLTVLIGINDVADGIALEEYTDTLRTLLHQAVDETGCRLILADPFIIEPDRADPLRAECDRFAAAVEAMAAEFEALHVPTLRLFDAALASTRPQDWTDDRVHPNLGGHAVIADGFMAALGV